MRIEDFKKEYPDLALKDYGQVDDMSVEEVRECFGLPESEFRPLLAEHNASRSEFIEYEEDLIFLDDALPELPRKLYTVRVLGYGEIPREALRNFATLHPEEFRAGKFWFPRNNVIYRSLSGAKGRAGMLAFNGVSCEVVECTPDWRVHETQREKLARLEAENAALRARLGEVA